MTYVYIDAWRKDATLTAIVRATFPDYRRKKIIVQPATSITLSDLNWSGGTRSEYRACTLAGQSAGNLARFNQCAPWANPAEGASIPIPQGMIVARGGYFCGKESMLTLYVHPDDMPKYLAKKEAA